MSSKPIILYDNQYCHVVNNTNGEIELVEGPQRFVLPSNKSLYLGKTSKIVVRENEYIVIENPYDEKEKKNIYGMEKVIEGPLVRSLYPMETLKLGRTQKAIILMENEGVVLMALKDFDKRKAGERWLKKGPCSMIPSKYEKILKRVKAVQVSQNEAIYVRNSLSSELSVVLGPKCWFPNVDEELYEKELTNDEYKSLKLNREPSSKALQIQVQKGEALCVVNYKTNKERYVLGPKSYILGAHEGIKVLNMSGNIPKVENVFKMSVCRLGPDFSTDQFSVRTADNAEIRLTISYKWRFIVDHDELFKIFHGDWIGYACQSMRSRVRECVSKYNFENFHNNSSTLLRDSLFKEYEREIKSTPTKTEKVKFSGRFFQEFNFLIFQLDVKKIEATDREIGRLLSKSIQSSMEIMVDKRKELSKVESLKNEIINKVEIEKMRKNLITLENQNYTKTTLEKTKINGDSRLEKAKAESQSKILIQKAKLDLEIDALKQKMELLKGEAGKMYLQYVRAKNISNNVGNITVVPNNATLKLSNIEE